MCLWGVGGLRLNDEVGNFGMQKSYGYVVEESGPGGEYVLMDF